MAARAQLEELSDALVRAAKGVKVLSALSWPESTAEAFLASWRAGSPRAPAPRRPRRCGAQLQQTLAELEARFDRGDPVGRYLAATARSYRRATELLDHAGTPTFHRISRELYGGADGPLKGSELCHREAAEKLLAATRAMAFDATERQDLCVSAEEVARALDREWGAFFETPMRFVVDDDLSAKAAASATRVRLRAGTCFSEEDIAQLSAHEVGVHSLTARNGRSQRVVGALGLGAPRTTATQEGLATFAELVTGAIDLARLRRIALRIRAIGMAEDGAGFVELFEHLVEAGEPPTEAVHTTMRVFRGADVRGGHPFTKDVVYLKGLFAVHTFLRKAIAEHRVELVPTLFVGRLTLRDALRLTADERVDPPRYLPEWAAKLPSLAAFLAFSALIDHVDLGEVDLDDEPDD